MIQGTASSVGKSWVTAGLCRVFKQDGRTVSPFKSQNMALNSFITKDGREMGRAQVVQAEAAGVEPSADMNPILLKPTTDKRSQVIINGRVHSNMSAAEYYRFKPGLRDMIREVYNGLAVRNDIIVIEGAGSPAEINLRSKDIVNMGMAEIADAPVVLVGDIDRGGVFASLAGTMLLLTEEERKRVKGVIINKFRGDIEILKPGLKMLEDIIKVPVLGVLPMARLGIDDEDSVTERFSRGREAENSDIDIAVIKLPHISNFTDFNCFENIPQVRLKYVDRVQEMGCPDMIIIPGSKNTIGDLSFIRKTGIEAEIKRMNSEGVTVFGICGGYQMLGLDIEDPFKTESDIAGLDGMGLLRIRTVFKKEKTATQVEGEITEDAALNEGLKGTFIRGYEIHMGTSQHMDGCIPYLSLHTASGTERACAGGVRNEDGTVYGTYMHGIFDNMSFTWGMINNLRKKKGLMPLEQGSRSMSRFKEEQYNMLADILRSNVDIKEIYKIMDVGI